MAYNLGVRISPSPKYFTLLDPGAYQNEKRVIKPNKAPFLSRTPRDSHVGRKIWTHALYNQHLSYHIPNCSAMLSKQPRFPYEPFSAEDLEEILCKCGISTPCECPTENEREEDVICQGKISRHLFKGPTPRSVTGDEGLSIPSKEDRGFKIMADGLQYRIKVENKNATPPFYNARVEESTAFYRGCKWSKRTAPRAPKSLEVRPGPGHYLHERAPTKDEICLEYLREFKRKTAKQLRYMDMVLQKNLKENLPDPASYNPISPRGTDLQFTGAKAKRFPISKYDINPGPADYSLQRAFDPIKPPDKRCHADLPTPPGFGTTSKRFHTPRLVSPGPASYNVHFRECNFVTCRVAPFGTSAKRFKDEILEESDEEEIIEQLKEDDKERPTTNCIPPTWEFKSKTIRMKPLVKKSDEPSPADFPQSSNKIERSPKSQYAAPFNSSQGRFTMWYSFVHVHGSSETPGPATYSLEKPRCPPAFKRGPLYRSKRFPSTRDAAPSPNAYKISNGIETILATHNRRLNNNIKNQHRFHWEPPEPKFKPISLEEKEMLLMDNAISLLNIDEEVQPESSALEKIKDTVTPIDKVTKPTKMLRTFLYAHPVKNYF